MSLIHCSPKRRFLNEKDRNCRTSWMHALASCLFCSIAGAANAGEPSKQRISLDDCSVKPILGWHLARSKGGFEAIFTNQNDVDEWQVPFASIYGRWCGPGYPKEGENPKPYDRLDNFCKNHDQCYEKRGYFDCSCDADLVKSIQKIRKAHADLVSCKKNGAWTKELNPFYFYVEDYFLKAMKERSCNGD